jgi:hypothetical protein
MSDLTARVIDLKFLRDRSEFSHGLLKEAYEAFQKDNARLIEDAKVHAAAVTSAETALKAVAAEEYATTKERKPAPGIEIKLFKEYAIDEAAGLAWATEKQLCLIPAKLDVAAIKKLATVQPLPFVKIAEVPKVTIATDLSKLELPDSAPATAVA